MSTYLKTPPASRPQLKPALDVMKAHMCGGTQLRPLEKVVSARSLILTVTIHDMLDGDKQIYRMDCPLVETLKKRKARTQVKMAPRANGGEEDTADDDISINSASSDVTSSHLIKKRIYYRPQIRGAMVFPACHADVLVRLTVSEVTKYPNAFCLARSELPVTEYILKRQTMVVSQRLEQVHRSSMPIEMVPLSRLNIATSRGSRTDPSRLHVGHGKVTWGIVTATGSSTVAGPLLLLPDVDSWGAKKRTWSVVMDKKLYVYASTADLVPKEIFDLQNCRVAMHDNEVRFKEAPVLKDM